VASGTSVDGGVIMYNSVDIGGSLKVGGGLTVNTANVLEELANKQGALGGSSVVAVSRLTATDEVVADNIRASTSNALQCADNLAVTGSLTVNGLDIVQGFANVKPAFSVEAPLETDYDLNTGVTTLRVDTTGLGGNPFWCASKVSGNGTGLTRKGLKPNFSCSRSGTGVFEIVFEQSHPEGANYVVTLVAETYHSWVRASPDGPTASGFKLGVVNSSNVLIDLPFYFAVLA
jgi:hypothetical protein